MSISPGFSVEEIREVVREYHLQPYGQKRKWLTERGVSYEMYRRWEATVFAGDLDRGLVPREGIHMSIPPSQRSAFQRAQAAAQAEHDAELARLRARVAELEQSNDALGKAIGLLHDQNAQEPAAGPSTSDPSSSSPPTTPSSSS